MAKLGLNDSVVLTGRVGEEELAAYYRVADVYVSGSLHEGFGVPLVEAMAFGVPIVALARAAVPETVGRAGLLVKRRGFKALASCIEKAIANDRLREDLIAAGCERYQSEFIEAAMIRKLLGALDRIERIAYSRPVRVAPLPLTDETVVAQTDAYIQSISPAPDSFRGRGIVVCAGGIRYLTCAWVLVKQLRALGCRLPIQVWHRDRSERDRAWERLVQPLGVECVEAGSTPTEGRRPRGGWQLKSFAMLHAPFEEVLLLDADNVPVADPTYLFDEPEYRRLGAIFWPDGMRTPPDAPQWRIFNVAYRDEPEQESGQVLIDKRRCWQALSLANWFNEQSDYFYRVIYGDKDTFRFSWHRLGQAFAMPATPIESLPATLCQHDLQGRRVFQHRVHDKWSLGGNERIPGFLHEAECREFVAELRRRWDVLPALVGSLGASDRRRMRELSERAFVYERLGSNRWPMQLDPLGYVRQGQTHCELFWWWRGGKLVLAGSDGAATCELRQRANDVWEGISFRDPKQQCRLRAMATNPLGASAHA